MALIVGVSGVSCAVSVGRTCIGLGEGVAGSEPRGSGLRISFWGSSTTSFPLPSLIIKGRIFFLLFSMALRQHMILGHPAVPQKLLLVPLSIPPEAAAVEPVYPK